MVYFFIIQDYKIRTTNCFLPTIHYLHLPYFQFSLSADSEYLYQLQVEATEEEEVLQLLQYSQELFLLEAVKVIPCHPDSTVKITYVKTDIML